MQKSLDVLHRSIGEVLKQRCDDDKRPASINELLHPQKTRQEEFIRAHGMSPPGRTARDK